MGFAEASGYLADLAARDKAVAAKQDQLVMGQMPQLVAGLAEPVKFQDIAESYFDPQTLDDIYAQMDDPGNHGQLTAAAQGLRLSREGGAFTADKHSFGAPARLAFDRDCS
jgi:hypothetical protein